MRPVIPSREAERRPTSAADAARGRAALHCIAAQDDTGVH